jgi:hypothetical protein
MPLSRGWNDMNAAFMSFKAARQAGIVKLMMLVWLESGLRAPGARS